MRSGAGRTVARDDRWHLDGLVVGIAGYKLLANDDRSDQQRPDPDAAGVGRQLIARGGIIIFAVESQQGTN